MPEFPPLPRTIPLLSASISDEKLRVWTMPHLTMQLSISVMSLQP